MEEKYLPSDRIEDSGASDAGMYTKCTWEEKYRMALTKNNPIVLDVKSDNFNEFMQENWMTFEEGIMGELILVGNPDDCQIIGDKLGIYYSVAKERIIVARHKAAQEWLKKMGIEAKIIEHATIDDVTGCVAYGVLPLYLAAVTACVFSIDMDIPSEYRGKELTIEDMKNFEAKLSYYKVR